MFHSPESQMFVRSIKDGTDETAQASDNDKNREFPNAKVGCFTSVSIDVK
jgi:hypothetical protein